MIRQNHLNLLSVGKRGATRGGNNLAGHCSVLRDFILINYFK